MADDVVVMYGGRVVERGAVEDIYYRPEMPYTWGLLGSVPRMDVDRGRAARADPRPAAVADPAAQGLRVPPALPVPRARPRQPVRHRSPGPARRSRPDHAVRCHLEPAQRKEIAEERLFARGGVVAAVAPLRRSRHRHRLRGGHRQAARHPGVHDRWHGSDAERAERDRTPEPGAPGIGSPAPSGSDPRTETTAQTAPEDPQ